MRCLKCILIRVNCIEAKKKLWIQGGKRGRGGIWGPPNFLIIQNMIYFSWYVFFQLKRKSTPQGLVASMHISHATYYSHATPTAFLLSPSDWYQKPFFFSGACSTSQPWHRVWLPTCNPTHISDATPIHAVPTHASLTPTHVPPTHTSLIPTPPQGLAPCASPCAPQWWCCCSWSAKPFPTSASRYSSWGAWSRCPSSSSSPSPSI